MRNLVLGLDEVSWKWVNIKGTGATNHCFEWDVFDVGSRKCSIETITII